MQYKGDDLDLRVPHSRAARESYLPDYDLPLGNGRWPRPQPVMAGGGEPLWVDDVLLACCNYAFDVAQANGAAEVGLEHLVNALTRVDAAARSLEARGVREGQLRRESAALIASEIPAANAGEAVAPRRSGELEDVLRRASDIAHRRGAAAGVEDVLWVLLHYGRDLPVLLLLRRLAPEWQRADWARTREPALPEPALRTAHLVPSDGLQLRIGSIEDNLRVMQSEFAAERKLLMDLVRDIQRDVVAQRGDGAAFRGDLGQRLESLERALVNRPEPTRLSSQLADRLSGLEKSVTGGLAETARTTRDLGQRLASLEVVVSEAGINQAGQQVLSERMAGLEKAVHSGLGEGARNWSHLGQRLASLENSIAERRDHIPALDQVAARMTALERVVQTGFGDAARSLGDVGQISQRLTAFEGKLGDGSSLRAIDAMGAQLALIERRLETIGGDVTRDDSLLSDQITEFGALIESSRSEAARLRHDLAERMSVIEAQLTDVATRPDAPARELAERLAGLERSMRAGFGDATLSAGQIAQRLIAVERGMAERPQSDSEHHYLLEDRLGTIEQMLETRSQQTLTATTDIVRRLQTLEQRPAPVAALDTASLLEPLGAHLASFEGSSLAKVDDLQAGIADVTTRLVALDERMRAEALVTEEALRGRDQDFDFIYSEIKQLGQSQTTLNSAVNDWRNESQSHFGTLANRLDKLQGMLPVAEPVRPTAAVFELPSVVKPMKDAREPGLTGALAATADRPGTNVRADDYALPAQPGRGFWYWLFGTGSIARSNRENDLKVDRMRQNIRDAREKRRQQV